MIVSVVSDVQTEQLSDQYKTITLEEYYYEAINYIFIVK